MKTYFRNALLLLAASGTLHACIDLEEMNVNPNQPSTTTPSLLLSRVAYDAFNETSSSACHATKMLILTSGESPYQVYKWTRGDFDYYNNLRNVLKLSEESNEGSAYQALAHFFRANYFYQLTMNFGSIPYSEALKAESEEIYQPAYDSQEEVMAGILKELDAANQILAESRESITGDIIYKGNLNQWRKLINAYRLRILMTLSHKEQVGEWKIQQEFARIATEGPLMEGLTDNGQLVYLDQQDNRYPYFNDSDFGSGRFMDSTYIAAFAVRKDPRLFAIATQTPNAQKAGKAVDDFTAYDGGDPAVPYSLVNDKAVAGNCSKPVTRYYQHPTNEPMILLGYVEQQLLLAEAVVRGWMPGDARAYYESAVRASFEFYRTYAPEVAVYLTPEAASTYLSQETVQLKDELSTDEKLERIAIQKYLPTFLQGSNWLPYYEALRTGYPELRRAAGVTLPFRWMYPQEEYNNNAQHVEEALKEQFANGDKTSEKPWWLKH